MQLAGIHVQPLLVGNRAPLQCLALKEALALLPNGSVQSVSWQNKALTGRTLEGRLLALTKCAVRQLNFRCGLFHPPPS